MLHETDLIQTLSEASAPAVSDAMSKCLYPGLRHQTMDAGIRPIHPGVRLCGPAFTVRCYPGGTHAVEQALSEAPRGSVLVCDGQGSQAGVLLGGIMSAYAKTRGVAGAVIDGAVRDVDEILELGFPVFCRHIIARSGTSDTLGEWGGTISCGSVVVASGDIIVGDVNGVVVVPGRIAFLVERAVGGLLEWERGIKARVCGGESLQEAISAVPQPKVLRVAPLEPQRENL